jgi:hypothetical protein
MATPHMKSIPQQDADVICDHENKIHHVDYDEFARKVGEIAYQNAKDAGLSDEIASSLREVWGSPIQPEHRF